MSTDPHADTPRDADSILADLRTRISHWRAGHRAGGMYAKFQEAAHAMDALPLPARLAGRERLNAIAGDVGVAMFDGVVMGPPDGLTLVCVVRMRSPCEALLPELEDAFGAPPDVRVVPARTDAAHDVGACEIWVRPPGDDRIWTRRVRNASTRIDNVLQLAFERDRIGNFVVYCATG